MPSSDSTTCSTATHASGRRSPDAAMATVSTMPAYLSFAEQALHYFDRPHEAMPTAPIGGPAAWRGEELARRDDWMVTVTAAQIAELDALRDALRARGLTPATLRREDVMLPTLAATI